MTISNDGATIMKLLDIVHPAAKVLADISMSQDAEVRIFQCYGLAYKRMLAERKCTQEWMH